MARGPWLDAHRLSVFRQVACEGSVRGAADVLGLTPSTVSQLVGALEGQVGFPLMEPAGRGISITAGGRELVHQAEPALEAMRDLSSWVTRQHDQRISTLSIRYIQSVGSLWLPTVVRRLLDEWPHLQIDLKIDEPAGPEAPPAITVLAEGLDYRPPSGYLADLLLSEHYVVLVPRTHALASQRTLRLGDVAPDHPIITTDADGTWCRDAFDAAADRAGLSGVRTLRAADLATVEGLVLAGLGVGVVPASAARATVGPVLVKELVSPEIERSVFALVRRSDRSLAHVDAALAAMADVASAAG